ncbi:MAG: hypothetical protein ABSA68_11905 [Xanthobacteraceae bacterium]|jgi:hypothetical protein
MIVSLEVRDTVDATFPDNWDGLRLVDLRETLDAFTTGEEITVGEHPHKKPNDCFMARVDPIALEVFDVRTLYGPGIRAFGCFLDKDCFAALTWDYREDMNFDYECKKCRHDWQQIFGSLEPFSKGKQPHEYLTKFLAV